MAGSKCMNCETFDARPYSHYCSDKCGEKFCKRMQGPVQCNECFAESDSVKEARKEGWKKVSADPEGIIYNFSGICPDCWRDGER